MRYVLETRRNSESDAWAPVRESVNDSTSREYLIAHANRLNRELGWYAYRVTSER